MLVLIFSEANFFLRWEQQQQPRTCIKGLFREFLDAHELQMEETEGRCLWAGKVPATLQGLGTGRQNETQLCNLLQTSGGTWTERELLESPKRDNQFLERILEFLSSL